MKFSRTWLQSYTTTPLPDIHQLADTLMLHAFEIEEILNDDVLDIDVLPNRAHDCLSHRGIAYELIGLLNLEAREHRYQEDILVRTEESPLLNVENSINCRAYTLMLVKGVTVKESPQWLKDYLESIGQRSINNIVDATNYIMFDLGQPLHAFDAHKVVGSIVVRNAEPGEKMITLSQEELELTEDDLVIADEVGVLALAGVKGGARAEVTFDTKDILVEVANFNPVSTRISARRHKIYTDSSKRFENEIHPNLIDEVLPNVTTLLNEIAGNDETTFSSIQKVCSFEDHVKEIVLLPSDVEKVLGLNISKDEILTLFDRFNLSYQLRDSEILVTPHVYRLDLNTKEDLIEEIGRWYGYYNIQSKSIDSIVTEPRIHPLTYLAHTLRNILIERGFSELYTYTFVPEGELKVKNPIGKDKQALRVDIETKLREATEKNAKNASYFNQNRIAVFEIGKVYTKQGEDTRLSICIENVDKKATKKYGSVKQQLQDIVSEMEKELGMDIHANIQDSTLSFSLSKLSSALDIQEYGNVFDFESYQDNARFFEISVFPYSTRDISVWVPSSVSSDEVLRVITQASSSYAIKHFLFDTFTKDEKTSYAYSIVFQSHERTLEDADIDEAMQQIYDAMLNMYWEVR